MTRLLNHSHRRRLALATIVILLSIPIVFTERMVLGGRKLGLGIAENFVPIHAVDYMRRLKIEGHIFNHIDFGDILEHRAPEIPIAIDGRDKPYIELRKQWARPHGFADFLRENNVTVVLDKIGFNTYPYVSGPWPVDTWAPVFLDNSAAVYLKRIPAYAQTIERDEYKFLKPMSVPLDFSNELVSEVNRCLANSPVNVYCLLKRAKLYELVNKLPNALADLNLACDWEPWNTYASAERTQVTRALKKAN
jgi:hypothetical protein